MSRLRTRRSFLGGAAAALLAGRRLALARRAPAERFAICNELFDGWPFEKAFAVAAECGYRGLEIAPFTLAEDAASIPARRREEVRKLAEAHGLQVVGLHWLLARTRGLHLTSADREVRRRTAAYLGELARLCADLGGEVLVFGSPRQRNLPDGVSREHGSRHAAEVLGEALPALERSKVILALEPLAPRVTTFLRTAAEAAELIRAVGSERVRLNLDCCAMATEASPIPELIRKHARHLVHFHANDPNGKGPGFGTLDFTPVFRALAEARYDGWISVEVFQEEPGPERTARESVRYMRRCLAESREPSPPRRASV